MVQALQYAHEIQVEEKNILYIVTGHTDITLYFSCGKIIKIFLLISIFF